MGWGGDREGVRLGLSLALLAARLKTQQGQRRRSREGASLTSDGRHGGRNHQGTLHVLRRMHPNVPPNPRTLNPEKSDRGNLSRPISRRGPLLCKEPAENNN